MKVEQSVIVITGAGGGLGTAIAKSLAEQGARLALIDFQADALQKIETELALSSEKCLALQCDVSNEDQVDQAFEN